jgi:UDPglucose 6-dehydrogenase
MEQVPIEMPDNVVIEVPTNYDSVKNYFDTLHVEEVIEL